MLCDTVNQDTLHHLAVALIQMCIEVTFGEY